MISSTLVTINNTLSVIMFSTFYYFLVVLILPTSVQTVMHILPSSRFQGVKNGKRIGPKQEFVATTGFFFRVLVVLEYWSVDETKIRNTKGPVKKRQTTSSYGKSLFKVPYLGLSSIDTWLDHKMNSWLQPLCIPWHHRWH